MKKRPFFYKVLASTLIATVVLSPTASVFAATTPTLNSADSVNGLNSFASQYITDANGDLRYASSYFAQTNSYFSSHINNNVSFLLTSEQKPISLDEINGNFASDTSEESSTASTSSSLADSSTIGSNSSSENIQASSSESSPSSSSETVSDETGNSSSSSSSISSEVSSVNSDSSSAITSSSPTQSSTADNSLVKLAENDFSVRAFVTRLYKDVHNRTPDPTGLDFWTNALETKQKTAAEVVSFFFESPEFTNRHTSDTEYLEILYTSMMGRPSDVGGMNYWQAQLNAGFSRRYVLRDFILSPEFSNICKSYNVTVGNIQLVENRDQNHAITTFVANFYQNFLDRNPDVEGINYWTGELLTHKVTGADVILSFYTSAEFTNNKVSNEEFLRLVYKTVLGREPDAGGFDYWMGYMRQGYTQLYILNQFVLSAEFADLCRNANIEVGSITVTTEKDNSVAFSNFVKRSFEAVMDREIDPGALNAYTQHFLSGKSAAEYFTILFTSAEFKSRNLSNQEIVDTIYRAILNRSADAGGLSLYVSYLNRGVSPLYVIASIISSSEFNDICNNTGIPAGSVVLTEARDKNIDVTDVAMNVFQALFNRTPNADDLNSLCSQFLGKNAESVLNSIFSLTASQEFRNRNLNSTDYINAIFKALCGRAPTAAETSSWAALLSPDNDSTRQTVFFLLGNSSVCSAYLGPKLGISMFNTQEKGIDVSAHQKNINWSQVASEGYTFAIIRAVSTASGGTSPYLDPYFYQNVRAAKAAGLKVGVYIFSYAKTTSYVTEEVNVALNAIRVLEKEGYRFEYPIVLDMETFTVSGVDWTEIARYGLVLIDQQGYYPCLYSYANSFKNGIFNMNILKGYDLWVAHYDVPAMSYPGSIWQYTSKGSVKGVSGNCDLNISYRDFATIIRNAKKNNLG